MKNLLIKVALMTILQLSSSEIELCSLKLKRQTLTIELTPCGFTVRNEKNYNVGYCYITNWNFK